MFPATFFIETICFFFAVVFLRNTTNVAWNTVKWFVLFTVVDEGIGTIIGQVYHKHNLWLINIYTFINFLTISWVIYRLSPKQKNNLVILKGSLLFFLLCFTAEILQKGIFEYTVISNIVSDITIFIICNRYFYLLLKEDSWIDIRRHADFWFITGLLLFSLCATITDLFDNQLVSLYLFGRISLHYLLYMVFNLILYGCWSFSFICKYRETI